MIENFKYISLNFIIFLLFSPLLSDDCTDNVNINENFFNEDIIGYYLSAIDLESGQSNVLLFDYSIDMSDALLSSQCISNPDLLCPLEDDDLCTAYYESLGIIPTEEHGINKLWFDFEIKMFVPELTSYSEGPKTLVDGTVRLDNIPNNLSQLSFRNTDLNFDTQFLQQGTTFHLENHNIYIEDAQIDNLTETFLSLGRLPNGVYYFNFYLRGGDNGSEEIDELTKEIEVFVPSYIDLISPGSSSLSDTLLNVEMSSNPVFQWNADYCNNCDLSIRVCEFRSNDHSSLSEAIEDYSTLPIESGFHPIDPNANTFQYPFSNVANLEFGKTYVWQLLRSYQSTSGLIEDYSNIFIFTIQSMEMSTESSLPSDENFENLKILIGEDKYNELFGIDGELSSFVNLNPIINVNGENMSVNFLIELVNKLNSGELNIIEVEVE